MLFTGIGSTELTCPSKAHKDHEYSTNVTEALCADNQTANTAHSFQSFSCEDQVQKQKTWEGGF